MIVKQDNGITHYNAYTKDGTTEQFMNDTKNKYILCLSLSFRKVDNNTHMAAKDQLIARIVAMQNPSSDPARIMVDHADGNSHNDTAYNLHWTTAAFNSFNTKKGRKPEMGMFGVCKRNSLFNVGHCGTKLSGFKQKETAGLTYNLLCCLSYGDQLDK